MIGRLIDAALSQRLLVLLCRHAVRRRRHAGVPGPAGGRLSRRVHHAGEDHPQGAGHDAGRRSRRASPRPSSWRCWASPQAHRALHLQVRHRRHHHRFRRRHRHLLGAPAGLRTPRRRLRDMPGVTGGMAPITTPSARCSCSRGSKAATHAPSAAPCSTGRCAPRCAPAGRGRRERWAGTCAASRWCPTWRCRRAVSAWPRWMQALEANNRNDGAGRLREGEETLLVRIEGSLKTLEDVRAVAVTARGGAPVTRGRCGRSAHRQPDALWRG